MSGSETERRIISQTLLSWLVRERMHQLGVCADCTMPDVEQIDSSADGSNWKIAPISGQESEACRQSLRSFLVEAKSRFNLPDPVLLEPT